MKKLIVCIINYYNSKPDIIGKIEQIDGKEVVFYEGNIVSCCFDLTKVNKELN